MWQLFQAVLCVNAWNICGGHARLSAFISANKLYANRSHSMFCRHEFDSKKFKLYSLSYFHNEKYFGSMGFRAFVEYFMLKKMWMKKAFEENRENNKTQQKPTRPRECSRQATYRFSVGQNDTQHWNNTLEAMAEIQKRSSLGPALCVLREKVA